MSSLTDRAVRVIACLQVVAVTIGMFGCTSGNGSKTVKETPGPSSANVDIDLNCVMDHVQNPPESFHYTFKDQSSNPWEEDADVSPQKIDGSFRNNSLPAPQEFHGTPQEASSNLRAIGRLASTMAILRGTSALVREAIEKVNGYDTVKYSIDTTLGTATEQGLFASVLGKGGSEKGTVWATAQGCPVKLVLDEELHSNDGSVEKAHYEEAMVKK